jgi:hypothetical protein
MVAIRRRSAILCGAAVLSLGAAPAALAGNGPGGEPSVDVYTERVPTPTGSKPVAHATKPVRTARTATAPAVTPRAPSATTTTAARPRKRPAHRKPATRVATKALPVPATPSLVTATGSSFGDAGVLLLLGGGAIALLVAVLALRQRRR